MNKPIRVAIFLFLTYFLISSKMFNQTILKNIPGAIEYEAPSEKGLFVGAFCLAIIYLFINTAVNSDLL